MKFPIFFFSATEGGLKEGWDQCCESRHGAWHSSCFATGFNPPISQTFVARARRALQAGVEMARAR